MRGKYLNPGTLGHSAGTVHDLAERVMHSSGEGIFLNRIKSRGAVTAALEGSFKKLPPEVRAKYEADLRALKFESE